MAALDNSNVTLSPAEVQEWRAKFLGPGGFRKFAYMLQWKDEPGWSFPQFHIDLCDRQEAARETLEIAPRGGGKSTIRSIDYPIWKLARNPNAQVLIGAHSEPKAKGFGRAIQGRLQTHEQLHIFFPELSKPKKPCAIQPWGVLDMSIEGRTELSEIETSLCVRGVGGDVVSKHFHLICMDDMSDEETAKSQVQREKMWEWFHESLLPCLLPGGEVHLSGTFYYFADIYNKLIGTAEKPGTWYDRATITPALDAKGESFWRLRFPKDPMEAKEIFDAMPPNMQAMYGEPFQSLEEKKVELGTVAFNAQMMGDVRSQGSIMFKPEWMHEYDDLPAIRLEAYMGVDLAIGQKTVNDYTAIVTVAIDDKTGNIYVLDAWRSRVTFHEQQEYIKAKYHATSDSDKVNGPHVIAIEDIAYQRAQVQELQRTTALPVKGVTPSKDKVTRASSLSALMENGKIHFHSSQRDLMDELLLFPEGDHDDMVDALVMAVDAARNSTVKQQPIYSAGRMRF